MSSPILTTQVQFRRGSASDNATLLGGTGELTVDLTNKRVIVHLGDGLLGGYTGANLNDLNVSNNNLSGYFNNLIIQSGASLISRDNSTSGVLNTTIRNSGQQAWLAANNNGINLSGKLFVTGSNLYSYITGLSGVFNTTTPVLTNVVYQTGNQIISGFKIFDSIIKDVSNLKSIDTNNKVLSSNGIDIYDWQNNALYSTDGHFSINVDLRKLVSYSDSFGAQDSLDWQNRLTYDYQGIKSINWSDRYLYDGVLNTMSVDWSSRILYDSSQNTSVNYDNRTLYQSDGITPSIVWNGFNNILSGNWTTNSIYISGSPVLTLAQVPNLNYNQSGSYLFRNTPISGTNQQFISFPANLGANPYVIASLNNSSGITNIFVQTSGITNTGYWAQYSNTIDNSGYVLTTLASLSSNSGLATTVIVQNFYLSGDAPFVVYTTGNQSIFNTKSFNISGAETFSVNKRGSNQAIVVTSDPYVYINYTGGITFISTEQAYINSKDDSYKIKFDNNNYGVVYGDWRLSDSPTQPNSISTKGYADSGVSGSYPRFGNPSGFISGFNSGIYITTGQTGQFYPSFNPSGFISGFNSGIYITTGQTGKFYSNTNPSGFINSGLLTGTLWPPTQNYNININWATANTFWHILTGNSTFNFSNQRDGQTIAVSVSNTGLANYTGIWPSTIKWPGQTVPIQTSGSFTDIYTFLDITGMIYGSVVQNF